MTVSEIAGIIGTVVAVIATAAGAAWSVVRLHTRTSDEKHAQADRRLTALENSSIVNQQAISEMRAGVAVLLERTKHMGGE
jgi:hypothetical protein